MIFGIFARWPESGNLRADILTLTNTAFGDPPDEFTHKLTEIKQRQPLRIVSVVVGDGTAQAEYG